MSLPTVAASAHGRHARTGPSVVPNWPGLVVRDPGTYTRLMAEQTSPVPAVVAGESPRGVSTDQPSLGEPICDNLADLLHRAADVLFASDAHCPALIAELRTRADRFAAVESVIGYGRGTAGE